jgi:hypothetical protein
MFKKRVTSFKYVPTPEEIKAMSVCNDNRQYVYPVPIGNSYKLTYMRADGFKQTGKETYPDHTDQWYKKVFEIYLILYRKL